MDKKEFNGSIVKQLNDILDYCKIYNRKKVIINKLLRDEIEDYPEVALREAIVNAFCHRDWRRSGEIKIEFFDDRVRIISPGGLPENLTLNNIISGVVSKRNPKLINVLDKINMIENYATGVRRIFEEYKNFSKSPIFDISENAVIVTLFNRNFKDYFLKSDTQNDTQNNEKEQNDTQKFYIFSNPFFLRLTNRQKNIIELINENNFITREELSKKLNISKSINRVHLQW